MRARLELGPSYAGRGGDQHEHATAYGSSELGRVSGHTSERLVYDGSLNLILDVGRDARREPEHARAGTEKD